MLHVSRPAVRAARVEAGGGRVEAGGRCCTCRRRRPVLDSGTRLGLHGSRPLVLVRSGGHATTPAATRVGDDREEAGGRRKTKLDHDRSGGSSPTEGDGTAANGAWGYGWRGVFAKIAVQVGLRGGRLTEKFARYVRCPRMRIQWPLLEFPKFAQGLWFP